MTDTRMLGLIPQGGVLDTDTGEVYPTIQETPTLVLARILGKVQHEIDLTLEVLYDAKRALGGELIDRMDKQGEWTVSAPGVKIVAPSPSAGTEDWDAELLDEILDALIEEGVLDRDAKLRAVTQRSVLHVDKRGVNALLKIPAVAERIAPARRYTPQGVRKASVRVDPRAL